MKRRGNGHSGSAAALDRRMAAFANRQSLQDLQDYADLLDGKLDEQLEDRRLDPVVEFLMKNNIRVTRTNYLKHAYAGQSLPDPLPPELEAELPPELQTR